MTKEHYRKLAQHLVRLPGGFPPSKTGAELRLLAQLFTPEEARLAVHLTLDPEDAAQIAAKAAMPAFEVEQRLGEMAQKGLVFSIHSPDGPPRYHAVPWVVGIYDFQVNNLTEELRSAMADYWRTQTPAPRAPYTTQMRTIPIRQSIEPHLEALPYECVDALVASHSRFAVAPCICRRHARLEGGGCDAPEESCLLFGDFADFYVSTGRGRPIDREELIALLARADEANLVLQPTNSQEVAAICCCCGCCCGVLDWIQRQPRPAEVVSSAFIARFDPDACQGCWTCLDRCQMHALSEDGERVAFDADRCIGCGLCVSTCPTGALTLARKPGKDPTAVPPDLRTAWHRAVDLQSQLR